jgi:membrane-bound lytic murein transglycosylase D
MSVDALRAVNGIGAKAKVPNGHMLLVPSQGPADAAAETLSHAVFTTVPQGRTFYYRVVRGDTLSGIASRYAVTVADIRRWNGLGVSGGATTGQRLRITSDLAPMAARSKRAAGKTAKPVAAKPKVTTVSVPPKAPAVSAKPKATAASTKPKATAASTKPKARPAAKTGTGAPTAKAKATAGS